MTVTRKLISGSTSRERESKAELLTWQISEHGRNVDLLDHRTNASQRRRDRWVSCTLCSISRPGCNKTERWTGP